MNQNSTLAASSPSTLAVPAGHLAQNDSEIEHLAEALTVKFEELTLIHQLSEQLTLAEDSDVICNSLLQELGPCINAMTLAIELLPDEDTLDAHAIFQAGTPQSEERLIAVAEQTRRLAHPRTDPAEGHRIAIANNPADSDLPLRSTVVPIERQGNYLGQMIAIRPLDEQEFGTIEADLMRSTSLMLGAHLVNQRQYRAMEQMFEGTIQSLVSALDAKDAYTCGHSSRVAELTVELAGRLGYNHEQLATIRMAGILHDIGKIGVEDSVLRKPGRLTDEEFEKIKQHPVLGYEILRGVRQFRKILPAVRHHHESWDGTGYPDGLVGDSIPRDAQILAVADAFDAMTSDRPYRTGMPLQKVIAIFREGRGTQWAADVVDVLLACPEVMATFADRQSSVDSAGEDPACDSADGFCTRRR